ncbi:MAG: MEDS domain-containing protein [Pseudonocardia sediminis]
MPRTISDLDMVGHTCLMPDSDEHAWEATAAWIAGGLVAGERVIYFEDCTADRLLERLDDDRVPVESAIADGQFQIVPTEQTRAMVSVPMDQVETVTEQVIGETIAQGWPGMRLIGEAARGRMGMGLDELVAYETGIDNVLSRNPTARLLCLYDRQQFDDEAVAAMRSVHGTEYTAPPSYDDGLLRVTRPVASTLRLAGEIDHSNRSVLRRMIDGALEQTLREVDVPVDVTLDLASLRFLDVAGAVELLRGAQQFPAEQRVVLRGPRARVMRALRRCGAESIAQLVVEPRTHTDAGAHR